MSRTRTPGRVSRPHPAGNCDFENDGTFNPTLHGIVENESFVFAPACRTSDTGEEIFWYYDEANSTFTQSAP